jgi:hypothetical protein
MKKQLTGASGGSTKLLIHTTSLTHGANRGKKHSGRRSKPIVLPRNAHPSRKERTSCRTCVHSTPPNDAFVKKSIPYPAADLTISDLMDDEAQRFLSYVAQKTGRSPKSLLSEIVKEWYDASGSNWLRWPR